MITLQCLLKFSNKEDEELLKNYMRRWSSCFRYAYNRLIDKYQNGEFEIVEKRNGEKYVKGLSTTGMIKDLREKFKINADFASSALKEAVAVYKSAVANGYNPKKVIFGGKKLFEKLSKKHLEKEKLKKKWQEKRKYEIFAIGRKRDKGNRYFKILPDESDLKMRIAFDKEHAIYARVIRKVRREKDKWNLLMNYLPLAEEEKFNYSVRIKVINGKFYAFISFEEGLDREVEIDEKNGVIGVDLNAGWDDNKWDVAWAEVSKTGNLESYGKIKFNGESLKNKKKVRENEIWLKAHELINIAEKKKKAIVLENLINVKSKLYRGDGRKKLRRKIFNWAVKSLIEKVEILAKRKGIKVIKVCPSYSSVIAELKYCPQFLLDRDAASALVIGRRGLGFKEKIPKNYLKLLNDKDFLFLSLEKIEEKRLEMKERIKKENNKWKRNRLKSEYKKILRDKDLVKKEIEKFESLESEPVTRKTGYLRKERVRGLPLDGKQKCWQVLKATLSLLVLEKSFARDFSPLRKILIRGLERAGRRVAPDSAQGRFLIV